MSVPYHGGVPDLKPGDTIEPGHSRDNHDDCPIRRARREKDASAIEGTGHPEQVYRTRYRDHAALHAARESADMRYIMRETERSIAEQEARQTYPAEHQYDSREAYMRGRAAPPTNAQIGAVAKRPCHLPQPPLWFPTEPTAEQEKNPWRNMGTCDTQDEWPDKARDPLEIARKAVSE